MPFLPLRVLGQHFQCSSIFTVTHLHVIDHLSSCSILGFWSEHIFCCSQLGQSSKKTPLFWVGTTSLPGTVLVVDGHGRTWNQNVVKLYHCTFCCTMAFRVLNGLITSIKDLHLCNLYNLCNIIKDNYFGPDALSRHLIQYSIKGGKIFLYIQYRTRVTWARAAKILLG